LLAQFSLGREVKEEGVLDCVIWGDGLCVLTKRLQLWAVTDLMSPRLVKLADCGLDEPPTSWCVMEPRFTLSGTVEVLVATRSGTILVVDADGVEDQLLSSGPFTRLAVAPTGKILACFSASGKLIVVTSDFSKTLSEFDTQSKVAPEQLVWCGTDSVLLYWEEILLMVGPAGDWIKYSYEEPIELISECDGVRILSNSLCEFLQRVPNVTEKTFSIGSTAMSAMLFDAWRKFQERSPKADELLRHIKRQSALSDAVDACIEAAGHEYDYGAQRDLLKAASFGKSFLDFYYADNFVDMCRTLRVLNCVRAANVGLPLSFRQFKLLGADALIDRLISRHHHLLAWRICQYLKVKGDRVLVNWACAKVRAASGDPASLCKLIVDRLSTVPGISYAEIASTAYRSGSPALATLLLEHEPRAADQVPLLISMQQDEMALRKAIESGDTDLVYLVLLQMKRALPRDEFFALVHDKPVALNLLVQYCREQDLAMLKDIYYRAQRPVESGNIAAMEAYRRPDLESRLTGLQLALNMFKEGGKAGGAFEAKATEDQVKLLLLQRGLEAKLGTKLVDCSLSETIYRVVALGHMKRAAKIKSEFKVPDKRYYWIKIRALADSKSWEELAKFAKERRPPIGFRPFADVCMRAQVLSEAARYIPRIDDESEQLNLWVAIERFNEAADVALAMKSLEALQFVRSKCKDPQSTLYIDKLMAQLK
jgi:vacuolar protein sorting-associated protein 16